MRLKLDRPGLWLSAISAVLVVAFVYWDSGQVSPGEISATHAQDPRLAGDGCEQCHGSGAEPMATACAGCHADTARQIAERRGLHGTMDADANACGACHSEHHGREFPLAGARSFALAGVADRERFDHARLDYHLTGRHASLRCGDCHEHADAAVLAQGEKRFAGLTEACTRCHEDVHAGKLPDCAACHGQEHEFRRVANFVHGAQFPLTGSHAKPGCLDCHPKGSAHAVEALASGISLVTAADTAPRACQDCHPSPHAEAFVRAAALRTGVGEKAVCETCHLRVHTTFAASEAKMDRARHGLSGFTLDAPHDRAQCSDCHAETGARPAASGDPARPPAAATPLDSPAFAAFRAAHPGRSADDCGVCHGDPHGAQFAQSSASRCLDCHDKHWFAPHRFDVERHAGTAFALTGSHAGVACDACHTQSAPLAVRASARKPAPRAASRIFHGTPAACESCHRDAHERAFDRAELDAVVDGERGCARCHTTNVFAELWTPGFDHAKWTGFALEGAHARSKCASCHAPRPEADEFGRTFGRVADRFHGSPSRCSTCHADAHRGFFERPELAAELARAAAASAGSGGDGGVCAQCHTQESFRDASPAFDHARFAGYALEGAHARAACTACHPRSAAKDASGRDFGFARVDAHRANSDCRACHVDPHRGGFDRAGEARLVDGRAGCLRCHSTDSFAGTSRAGFDHALWTGFALDGAHANATCESCHAPRTNAKGTKVFGPAAGTDCAACHADPHVGQFAELGRTDCARCHAADVFDAGHFDHRKNSRFALDATHAKLACSACHLPAPLPGGGTAIRYKPLGVTCADCHDPRRGGRAPRSFGAQERP